MVEMIDQNTPQQSVSPSVPPNMPVQPSFSRRPWMVVGIVFLVLFLVVGFKLVRKVRNRLGGTSTAPIVTNEPRPGGGEAPTGAVCTRGASVACSELGESWSGGTATCREDGSGYDLSECTRARLSSSQAEVVKPGERNSWWEAARCNDGTPFTYEVQLSPSGSSEWLVYLEGGGFCDDNAKSCASRDVGHSSTLRDERTGRIVADREIIPLRKAGIFSADAQANPTFYDANKVFAEYCSSDAWSGATTERRPTEGDPQNGWYFSGRHNVRALFESLIALYGLDDGNNTTKVLFSGGSAGGGGVNINADTAANLLPRVADAGRLMLVNDAGATTELFDNSGFYPGEASEPIRDVFLHAFAFFGSRANAVCEEALKRQGENVYRCGFTAVNYPYVFNEPPEGLGLPYLVAHSSIDEFGLGLYGINPQRDTAVLEAYRDASLESFEGISWLFSGGHKPYHTILTKDGVNGWHMGPPGGPTLQELITRMWEGKEPQRVVFGNP